MTEKQMAEFNQQWTAVETGEETPCHIWTGETRVAGNRRKEYGKMKVGKSEPAAHRLIYLHEHGNTIGGKHIHHKCKQTLCVNVEHLEALEWREHIHEKHKK